MTIVLTLFVISLFLHAGSAFFLLRERSTTRKLRRQAAEWQACTIYLAKYGNKDGKYRIRYMSEVRSSFVIREGEFTSMKVETPYPKDADPKVEDMTIGFQPIGTTTDSEIKLKF